MSPQKLQIHFIPFSMNLMKGLTYALQSLHLTIGFYPKLTDGVSSPYNQRLSNVICSYGRISIWLHNDAQRQCNFLLECICIRDSISGHSKDRLITIELLQWMPLHWSQYLLLLNLLLLLRGALVIDLLGCTCWCLSRTLGRWISLLSRPSCRVLIPLVRRLLLSGLLIGCCTSSRLSLISWILKGQIN